MQKNPYVYNGPVRASEHKDVCIFRETELGKVISGIQHNEYWTITGPRQIGKTTFLHQIIHEFSGFPFIYLDMEISPSNENAFYDWIIDEVSSKLTYFNIEFDSEPQKKFGPEINFFNFLKSIKSNTNSKILLFFDEIKKDRSVESFLHLWRKVYHERTYHQELNKFSVIIAGSVDLIALTIGPTSPFNISKKLSLNELTKTETLRLIREPMEKLEIVLEPETAPYIFELTSGHPQMTQHLCSLLVDNYFENNEPLSPEKVDARLDDLMFSNDSLKTLDNELKADKSLQDLVRKIQAGEQVPYFPRQEYSLRGTGPIVPQNRNCAIRNKIYEIFLREALQGAGGTSEIDDCEYVIKFIMNSYLSQLTEVKPDENLLEHLFKPNNTEIEIYKNNVKLNDLKLDNRDKLIFTYLGFKRLKADEDGYTYWEKIPFNYKYRLSSNVQNNKKQLPEWDYFTEALDKEPDEDIRVWVYAIREKLSNFEAKDIIYSKKEGRGQGYILKGIVEFEVK